MCFFSTTARAAEGEEHEVRAGEDAAAESGSARGAEQRGGPHAGRDSPPSPTDALRLTHRGEQSVNHQRQEKDLIS